VAEARGDPEEELASLRSNLEYWREREKLQVESGKPPRAPSRRVRYADTDSDEDDDVSDEDDDFEANEDGENEEGPFCCCVFDDKLCRNVDADGCFRECGSSFELGSRTSKSGIAALH
jgi:hypothetical protein